MAVHLTHNHRPFCTHTACMAGLRTCEAIEREIGEPVYCGYRTRRQARRVLAKVERTGWAGYFSIRDGACPELAED